MSRRDKRGRDAVSRRLTERLSQIYIKKSNRKFSLRFEKEETGSEEKRLREQRGLVPSRLFLTRLRRPYLFRLAGKDRGEKGARGRVWCVLPLNLGEVLVFGCRSTRDSPYVCLTTRRLIRRDQICS